MGKTYWTEDEVRDSAKLILGFDKTEDGVQQGTGQITTFNQLGFRGCNDKPDGWYLPDDASKPAIILETKSEAEGVSKEKHVKELFKNIDVVAKKYSKTIGILYSGSAIRVFKNKIELSDASKHLEDKNYYSPIDEFGGATQFSKQIANDNLKRKYAQEHNIPLHEISYKDKQIDKVYEILYGLDWIK